jgi:predicted cytidylate kinase
LLVTISGLPGSGTSTIARAVASALGLPRLDGGTVFRSIATERGLTLAEFGALAEQEPSVDLELDARLAEAARAGDVVLESRLAGWIARNEHVDGLRVWIGCDERERARRVGGREGVDVEVALAANRSREASEALRYRTYYDIEITDLRPYDLVLDSTSIPPDQLVSEILGSVR